MSNPRASSACFNSANSCKNLSLSMMPSLYCACKSERALMPDVLRILIAASLLTPKSMSCCFILDMFSTNFEVSINPRENKSFCPDNVPLIPSTSSFVIFVVSIPLFSKYLNIVSIFDLNVSKLINPLLNVSESVVICAFALFAISVFIINLISSLSLNLSRSSLYCFSKLFNEKLLTYMSIICCSLVSAAISFVISNNRFLPSSVLMSTFILMSSKPDIRSCMYPIEPLT